MNNYFRHDFYARNDEKINNLIMKSGYEGLGLYWCILEMLYENDGWIDYECERIAFALRTDKDKIDTIIASFDLFIFDKSHTKLSSKRILEQIKFLKSKSEKAKISANIRWKDTMRTQCDSNAKALGTRMQIKENKIKENKSKLNNKSLQAKPAETDGQLINSLLKEFEPINPTINYGNKTQRKALQEMIKQFTYEKLLNTIKFAISIQGKPYSPVITTPYQLKENMGKLLIYYKKEENKKPLII